MKRYLQSLSSALIISLLFLPGVTLAQHTGTVKGRVLTSDKQPAEGVTLQVKGTHYGVPTGPDGTFRLYMPAGEQVLVISSVGSVLTELPVTVVAGSTLQLKDITVERSSKQLSEVVIQSNRANKFSHKNTDYVARMPLSNLENPQVYHSVSKELLQEQIVNTTEGILQNVPGLSNIAASPGGGGTSVGFMTRGFNTGYTSTRNGLTAGLVTLTDPVNIERVEALKGPSSTLFGANLVSYGGLVNIVTKQPTDVYRGEISYTGGSNELSRFTADINTPLNADRSALFRINAAYDNRKSFQDFGKQQTVVVAPSFIYKPSEKLTLRFDMEYFRTKRPVNLYGIYATSISNFADLNLDPKRSYIDDGVNSDQQTLTFFARADYKISDTWTSQTNYSYGRGSNNTPYIFLNFLDNNNIQREIYDIPVSDLNTLEIQQNFIGDFKIGNLRNRLLVGLDYSHFHTNSQRQSIVVDTISKDIPVADQPVLSYSKAMALGAQGSYNHYFGTENIYSTYASDVLNLTDNFLAMASLRVDRYHTPGEDGYSQTAFSPKFGLVYQLLPQRISVFANYMNGFQNVSGMDDNGNKYKPQQANQLEGGFKFELFDNRLNATVSYYDIKVKDVLRTVTGFVNQVQDGTAESKGIDLDIVANPAPGFNIVAGYGYNNIKYLKADDGLTGKRPQGTPAHSGNLWLSYKFQKGSLSNFGIGAGGNAVSKSFTDDQNLITFNGYAVANATVFYDVAKVRFGVKVDNLADKKYWVYNYYPVPQPGRIFSANVTYRFN